MSEKGSKDELVDGLLRRLAGIGPVEAAELLVLARERIREQPVEHAKAATDVTRALGRARSQISPSAFQQMRTAVLLVARRDWPAAAQLAEQLAGLAALDEESIAPVGEAVARTVLADRALARQLAASLPLAAQRVESHDTRSRIIVLLGELCRKHPGLGLAAIPSVRILLDEGRPEGLATFLEEALRRARDNESVARSFLLRESQAGRRVWDAQIDGLPLAEVARSLQFYAEAHLDFPVRIRSFLDLPDSVQVPDGALAVTDGRQIFLAPRVDRFEDPELNFRLYKVATAHEVGRIEFGSFRLDPWAVPGLDPIEVQSRREGSDRSVDAPEGGNPILAFARRFPDADLARRVLLFAEDLRVDSCLRRSYPGLARDLDAMAEEDLISRPELGTYQGADLLLETLARWLWFGEELPEGPIYRRFHEASWLLQALRHPGAGVQDSAGAAALLYRLVGGGGEVEQRSMTNGLDDTVPPRGEEERWMPSSGAPGSGSAEAGQRFFTGGVVDDVEEALERELEERAKMIQAALEDRGVPVSMREVVAALRADPEQSDRGLERSLVEAFREGIRREAGRDPAGEVESGTEGPGGSLGQALDPSGFRLHSYSEWDHQIGDYRPDWVSVWERPAEGEASAFVDAVLQEHRGVVSKLRRDFQMLRPQGIGRERRAPEGEQLDLDALIHDLVDLKSGQPPEGRVYLRTRRSERDVAVAFLVDLSASTREPIGDSAKSVVEVEKEALILMSEALEALGDRYAIFGFSGRGRKRVTFDVFKDFDERLNSEVRGRVGAMNYRMENRDGAAIRHATNRLLAVPASTRLLILLSDGKPLDCGCDLYQSDYAVADTQMALREARQMRVHPFCITVDPRGEDYVSELFGDVRYALIDSVEALPRRLPAIYRKLTS